MYVNPYAETTGGQGRWLKANFHVHADEADARYAAASVLRLYAEAGYDVVTISDQRSLVDTSEVGAELGLLTINGIEYIEADGILCLGIREFLSGEPQEVVDACREQGGFSVVAHPNWISEEGLPTALTRNAFHQLAGYVGIEVFTPGIFHRFRGSGLATDLWDELLSGGHLVWGFANDDFHIFANFDRGWNMIFGEATYVGVKDAVERGRCYASSGLYLRSLTFDGHTLDVRADLLRSSVSRIRYEFIGPGGKLLHESVGESGRYQFVGDERYVRVQATAQHGAMLWTQPIYDSSFLT